MLASDILVAIYAFIVFCLGLSLALIIASIWIRRRK